MAGYCNFFQYFCDDYEQIEKEQDETGENCYIDCQDCEALSKVEEVIYRYLKEMNTIGD